MIDLLRALMDKVDSTQEQMGNVSREMEVLRKNQDEGLQVKSTGAQMRIYLGGPRQTGHS